jgi:hypothetical protein
MKFVTKGSLGAIFLGAALFAAPAWSGSVGEEVPNLGTVIYNEGKVELIGGKGPDVVTFGVGAFDFAKTDPASVEGRIEYRWGQKLAVFGPTVGVLANSDGGVFGYVGTYLDFRMAPMIITPSLGFGYWHEGDSKDLGGNFPFIHFAIDMAYAFESGARLGIKLAHISNAYTHSSNPGQESILLTFALPLGNMF